MLNPLSKPDERIMDDADLAGPVLFCFCFGMVLLFVRSLLLSRLLTPLLSLPKGQQC